MSSYHQLLVTLLLRLTLEAYVIILFDSPPKKLVKVILHHFIDEENEGLTC